MLLLGDCLAHLRAMPSCSVDAIVTDPPYGLSFMGKKWDYDVPSVEVWAECLRVLKPGGHLLAFAGTRTQHRMAVRIEDAGFEIRDMIAWVYGSGFPKSMDVSKAIDKAAGAEREVVGTKNGANFLKSNAFADKAINGHNPDVPITAPATPEAQQWSGWGTALKPALEPITMARKPLIGTVAANVLAHGTGGINVDGCRVGTGEQPKACKAPGWDAINKANADGGYRPGEYQQGDAEYQPHASGRWPANLIHDGSAEVVELFPQSAGQQGDVRGNEPSLPTDAIVGQFSARVPSAKRGDTGSAARFFYCAKASKVDRDDGNTHPTVKPTDLMRYLCRLVTPPCGVVLDPFMGSGSTGKAAILEGFDFIGIEREPSYFNFADSRIEQLASTSRQQTLF